MVIILRGESEKGLNISKEDLDLFLSQPSICKDWLAEKQRDNEHIPEFNKQYPSVMILLEFLYLDTSVFLPKIWGRI